MLVGRDHERRQIDEALALAAAGTSATLALVGEPGIGKTTLLDYAAERSAGMRLLRARGIESEAQIPFASLLEVIRPALALLDQIPVPQAAALEGALALRPGTVHDRFAVGAATLSLLAACAEQHPVALLLDDAQWLDRSSAQALVFAFRRLLADPIAVIIAVREGEPSLLDGTGLPELRVGGLTTDDVARLLPGLTSEAAGRLHRATAGNPLALLELGAEARELTLAPDGAPLPVSARITRAFLCRAGELPPATRQALVLAAASDTGDLPTLERAAATLAVDLSALAAAEGAGLVTMRAGTLEFRHPLARSAVYADASASQCRDAHRALAAALPDRDIDVRAWHLAMAATGTDETASAALEQAGNRGLDRSAHATAAAAFERAARLTASGQRRPRLLQKSAEAGWLAGYTGRAVGLLDEARAGADDPALLIEIDELAGHIATRCGPVMRGYEILMATAETAASEPERAVAMLAEAAFAGLYAGRPDLMRESAKRACGLLPAMPSARARFLAAMTAGMAEVLGGDAAAGAVAVHEAVALAEGSPELREDLRLIPWVAIGPLFLRRTGAGRSLLDHALLTARARDAVGALPFVLNLIARGQAASDRWALAGANYEEAIGLARESGQQTELTFGLAGLALLQARRGREPECRAGVAETIALSRELGSGLLAIWAAAALGELELGLGDAASAAAHFEHQLAALRELAITDADLSPASELVDAYARLGRADDARRIAGEFMAAASAKALPWPMARAQRCQGIVAADGAFSSHFEQALRLHEQTPDAFETARTQLAYGERLRRARHRILARDQLRGALEAFERLDARPWAGRARSELAATGERLRHPDPSTTSELTPQELQIAVMLAAGRTTRETAVALFVSPKTVEYHLRHVYQKLGINSREQLADRLASVPSRPGPDRAAVGR